MPKVLVGRRLTEAQEQFKAEKNEDSLGVPVKRPSGMTAMRELMNRKNLKNSDERFFVEEMENIVENREDGTYNGKSYLDSESMKSFIIFQTPNDQEEITGGYYNEGYEERALTIEELASIAEFKYKEQSQDNKEVYLNANGQKVSIIPGNVSKEKFLDDYAKQNGFESFENLNQSKDSRGINNFQELLKGQVEPENEVTRKDIEKGEQAFKSINPNEKIVDPYDGPGGWF